MLLLQQSGFASVWNVYGMGSMKLMRSHSKSVEEFECDPIAAEKPKAESVKLINATISDSVRASFCYIPTIHIPYHCKALCCRIGLKVFGDDFAPIERVSGI